MTVLIIWHETWVRDSDTLMETVLAVTTAASGSYLAIAVGTAVFVDVLMFGKTVFQNAKRVFSMLTEILKDALKRHEQKQMEEKEREEEKKQMQKEIENLKQRAEADKENVAQLQQRVGELEEELKRKSSNS